MRGALGHLNARLLLTPQAREALELTDEQVQKIEQADFETQNRVIDLDAQAAKADLELQRLTSADELDRGKILERIDAMGKIQTDQRKLNVERHFAIQDALTADQIQKARDLVAERLQARQAARWQAAGAADDGQDPAPAARGRRGGRGGRGGAQAAPGWFGGGRAADDAAVGPAGAARGRRGGRGQALPPRFDPAFDENF
jgi:Spy/CpxP family protein refolding chaperone